MTFLRSLNLGRAVAAVAAAIAVSAGSAKADIILDDFTTPTPAVSYQINGANPNPYTSPAATANLGQSRVVEVNVLSGVGAFSATGQIGGGTFELSTPAASTATAKVSYAFTTSPDLASLVVTGITLSFNFADLSVPYSITVTDTSSATATAAGTITGAGSYTTSAAAFAGVNLGSISSLEVFLNNNVLTNGSTTSADFILTTVTLNTQPIPPDPVPAPPAAFLALLAAPAFGVRKWLKKA